MKIVVMVFAVLFFPSLEIVNAFRLKSFKCDRYFVLLMIAMVIMSAEYLLSKMGMLPKEASSLLVMFLMRMFRDVLLLLYIFYRGGLLCVKLLWRSQEHDDEKIWGNMTKTTFRALLWSLLLAFIHNGWLMISIFGYYKIVHNF